MRLIVCGSRTYSDEASIFQVLDGFRLNAGGMTLIEGGAKGADRIASNWTSTQQHVEHIHMPAAWNLEGMSAGLKRNERMLTKLLLGEPRESRWVLAFVDKPLKESRGTAHMVMIARVAQVNVLVIEKSP